MAMVDSTVANLAVESIRSDFATNLTVVQWVITGYLIALVVSLPAAGWLGRRFGYGRVWKVTLGVFVTASALCGVAPRPSSLIGARLLQGLAAGIMVPAGQAVIGAAAGPAQLGRIFGALGLVVALGPAVGPAAGGLLLEVGSWRWLFWINIPIGITTLLTARGLVPPGAMSGARPMDWKGLILLGGGLSVLLYGASDLGSGPIPTRHVVLIVVGAMLSTGFVLTALHSTLPLLDLRLLYRRGFGAATATAGLTGVNMYGGLLLLPLYFQIVEGRGIAETGWLLLAMGLGSALALPAGGWLTDRYGARRITLVGAALLVLSTGPFLFPGILSVVALTAALILRGIGLAWAQMPAMAAAYGDVSTEQLGDATTLVNIAQRVGSAVGTIAVVLVLARDIEVPITSAYVRAFAWLLLISMLTAGTGSAMRAQARDNLRQRPPAA